MSETCVMCSGKYTLDQLLKLDTPDKDDQLCKKHLMQYGILYQFSVMNRIQEEDSQS